MTDNWYLRLTGAVLVAAACLYAEPARGDARRTIDVVGRKEIAVTTASFRLSDVANVSSTRKDGSDDDALIALQKIVIEKSPAPGGASTISAAAILERLRSAGVNLDGINYTLPRILTVKRAGRVVTSDEVKSALRATLARSGSATEIRSIDYREGVFVAPGLTNIEASSFAVGAPGRLGFNVTAKTEGAEDVSFTVQASVEEWSEVPVARRPLGKGELISSQDIMRARLNLAALPRDAVRDDENVIGLATSEEVGYGEFFRRPKLAVPPMVAAGGKVTIVYHGKFLDVTATGTAIEAGIKGQDIKVQNDSSKRILRATILEPGIVGVKP